MKTKALLQVNCVKIIDYLEQEKGRATRNKLFLKSQGPSENKNAVSQLGT